MRYTKDHEWVCQQGDHYMMGISEHAVRQLGDIVFLELPEVGKAFGKGDAIAVVESVKAASDVYAPVSGEVIEVHQALADEPGKLNEHKPVHAWFIKFKASDEGELEALMNEEDYLTHIENE